MLSSKVELDVFQKTDIQPAFNLVLKYNIPAIVTHPDLMLDCIALRAKYQIKVKLLSIIDWPKGDNSGISKFRFINVNALNADGFEIMLGSSLEEAAKDVVYCLGFIRSNISQKSDIRFVINCYDFDRFKSPFDYLKQIANIFVDCGVPNCVRINTETKLPLTKINAAYFSQVKQEWNSVVNIPLKASGNVTYKLATECKFDKYALNLKQVDNFVEEEFKQV